MEGRRRAEVALAQISTGDFDLPSSVSCRQQNFRSTTSSNRVRCRWNASMHRSGVGDWSRRRWKTRRAIRAGALVLAEDHAELNGIAVGIPPGILWEREKHHCDLLGEKALFSNCSIMPALCRARIEMHGMVVQGERIAGGFILIAGIDGTTTRFDGGPWPSC